MHTERGQPGVSEAEEMKYDKAVDDDCSLVNSWRLGQRYELIGAQYMSLWVRGRG